jgi:hypothetical protein
MKNNQIRQQLNNIRDRLQKINAGQYDTWRDKDGYLFIKYKDDGFVERFPSFDLRPHQLEIQRAIFVDGYKNIFIMWTRRAGKEVISFICEQSAAIENGILCGMIYPTTTSGRTIIWEGGIYLKNKLKLFIDIIPKRLLKKSPNNKDLKINYLNTSVFSLYGTNHNPDRVRGTNEKFIVLAEGAFQDPRVRDIISPILTENKGVLIVQSTYDGTNHFYKLGEAVKDNPDWFYSHYTAETLVDENGDRYVTEEMIQKDRDAGMPEFMIQQEYYGVVQNNEESNYYATAMSYISENNKIISNLFLRGEPVYAGYDLGKNDSTVCTLFQVDPTNKEIIVLWCHSDNGKNFDHYIKLSKEFCTRYGLYLHTTFVPHDGARTSYYSDENALTVGQRMGEKVRIVERPQSKINAIKLCRGMLKQTSFNKEHTSYLIDCLSNYKKEFDKRLNEYKDHPLHNWASHGADSFQTVCLAISRQLVQNNTTEAIYPNMDY